MRYKNNVLEKLNNIEAITSRIQLQVNRSVPQEEVLSSIEKLKESIENVKEMVSMEDDEFAQQFK
jgi:hypothetical protein